MLRKLLAAGLLILCVCAVSQGQMRLLYADNVTDNNSVRKFSFYSPNEGYVAFDRYIGYTTDSGKNFVKLSITTGNVNFNGYSVNLTFGFAIAGVKAFDKNNLVVWGDYGFVPAILYSNNGGVSYKLVFHNQYDPYMLRGGVYDMAFSTGGMVGYATDPDRILKTTDGGLSWSVARTVPGSYFNHVEAIDDTHAFAMTDGKYANIIMRTTDGTSWAPCRLPQLSLGVLSGATFLNATQGWLSMYDNDQAPHFYTTTDAGESWTPIGNQHSNPNRFFMLKFVDANTGYGLTGALNVYKTLNGGATWEPLPRDNDLSYLNYALTDLSVYSPSQLWAGSGGHAFIEVSSNGGGVPYPKAYFDVDTTGSYLSSTVQLLNYSRTGYQYEWWVNNALVSTSYNATYQHVLNSAVDSVWLIVTGSNGKRDTLKTYQGFMVPDLPMVTGFAPQTGGPGTMITITGSGFTHVTGVSFGGAAATSYKIYNDNSMTAVVGSGATGSLGLTDIHGTWTTPGFVFYPAPTALPPVVSSFSPAAAMPGTRVTITGSGFGSGVSDNKVWFGAVAAVVESASPTTIVCTVPLGAGYEGITVLNVPNGLMGRSGPAFVPTFADSSNFTNNSFVSGMAFRFPPYLYPYGVAGKDVDGDGKPDLIADIRMGDDSIFVYRNTSAGGVLNFADRVNLGSLRLSLGSGKLNPEDLDGDGKPDLIAVSNNNYVHVLRNTSTVGHIAFAAPERVPTLSGSWDCQVADVDDDGRPDLVVAGASTGFLVTVVKNTSVPGHLSFGAPAGMAASNAAYGVAVGDVDGDGRKDVVSFGSATYNANGGSAVGIWLNTGTRGNASFGPRTDLHVESTCLQGNMVSLTDYDKDGKLDIVVYADNALVIFRNKSAAGSVSFDPAFVTALSSTGNGGNVASLNGDGLPDVVGGFWIGRSLRLWRNVSSPGVLAHDPVVYDDGTYPDVVNTYSTGVADFNMDGKTDIIGSGENMIVIYRNNMGVPITVKTCVGQYPSIDTDLPGSVYQWQTDSAGRWVNVIDGESFVGANKATLYINKVPADFEGRRFRCVADGRYSSTYVLQVTGFTMPGSFMTATDSVTCYGTWVIFSATDSVGGHNYNYRWTVNGVLQPDQYNTWQYGTGGLRNGDTVRALLMARDGCYASYTDTSNAIVMHVTELAAAVDVTASDTAVCAGKVVSFSSAAVNAGTAASYIWTVDGNWVSNGASFETTELTAGRHSVALYMSSSAGCVVRRDVYDTVYVVVGDTARAAVGLSASATAVCKGEAVAFTATGAHSDAAPVYSWLLNGQAVPGVTGGTYASADLRDGDRVAVEMTGTGACRVSNEAVSEVVEMKVSEYTAPRVALSVGDTAVCDGAVLRVAALGELAGDAPVYTWMRNGVVIGAGAEMTVDHLVDGDRIWVRVKSSFACAAPDTAVSGVTTVRVNGTVVPTVVAAGRTDVRPGETVSLSAVVTGGGDAGGGGGSGGAGGAAARLQWEDSTSAHGWAAIVGATSAVLEYTPAASGDAVRCSLVSGAACAAPSTVVSQRLVFRLTGSANVKLYPNPVTTSFYIDNLDLSDPVEMISISSITGTRVKDVAVYGSQQTGIAVGVAELSKGVYVVSIARASGAVSRYAVLKK